jgi:hypothetical protein
MVMAITARIAAVITTRVVITREDIMREGTMLADIIAAIIAATGRGEDTTITGVITTGGIIITVYIIATGGAIGAIVITGTTCGGRSAGTIAGSITAIAM